MHLKRKLMKGAILFEVVLSLSLNLLLLMGGLEMGWYLHLRQGLAGAAGTAVFMTSGKQSEDAAKVYLTGFNLPTKIIEAVSVSADNVIVNGSQADRVTVSLPLSEALIFGGVVSKLSSSEETTITAVAYNRIGKKR